MTIIEKVEMFQEKKLFVDSISKVFERNPKTHTVTSVRYEVYMKEVENNTWFEEWIIVQFKGDSISVRRATGNSNTANFRVVGFLIDGGDYEEVTQYEKYVDSDDWTLVALD